MLGSGQGAQRTSGHAGHARGSGHLTVGQRGRGHGGHSPILQGLEHVEMHGGHWGTLDLRTYLDMSGSEGHSVLSMYLLMSGIGGHGGTVALSTHLLGSGSGQGRPLPLAAGQAHGEGFLQTLQGGSDWNPSAVRRFPTKKPIKSAAAMATAK
jgi:hypothetical protein